ncbi:hypothetical protein Tco_0390389 [Tanacetum coccineum]
MDCIVRSTSTVAILQFIAKYKNHNSNEDFPNVLNTTNTNTKVANDSSSVHNPGPYGNSTSTRASENKKSDKAVTSPGASKRIAHLSSAEMQLRKKFLEEDRQFVMSGLMSDNEFWCIRKVKQRVVNCRQTLKTLKRDDVQLLRKFGIQFKGDPEQVRLQLPGVPFKSSKPDSADALDSKPKHEDQRRSNKTDNKRVPKAYHQRKTLIKELTYSERSFTSHSGKKTGGNEQTESKTSSSGGLSSWSYFNLFHGMELTLYLQQSKSCGNAYSPGQ